MMRISEYDYCTVQNCRFIAENATAGSNFAIDLNDTHHTIIRNNIMTGDYAVSAINATDTLGKSLMVIDNMIYNDDTASTFEMFENYVAGVINTYGLSTLVGTAASA